MDPLTLIPLLWERGGSAFIIAGLLYALRWAIQRGDAAQAAQILNAGQTAVQLHASTEALREVTRILNDFKQAEAVRAAQMVATAQLIDRRGGSS